jgi:hypothetical protein
LLPNQLTIKRQIEEFSTQHRSALETLAVRLLWREIELFQSASGAEIEAALSAFAPIAETIQTLPAKRVA